MFNYGYSCFWYLCISHFDLSVLAITSFAFSEILQNSLVLTNLSKKCIVIKVIFEVSLTL